MRLGSRQRGPAGRQLVLPGMWGGGYSPLALTGLAAWYDASASTLWQNSTRTTPVASDADPVGAWDDLSGNGRHAVQATAAARPTWKPSILNGRAVIRFDGTDDSLATAGTFLTTDLHTVLAVAITADDEGDLVGTGAASAGHVLLMRFADKARAHFWTDSASNELDSAGAAPDTVAIYGQRVASATIEVRVNRVATAAALSGTKAGATTAVYLGSREGATGLLTGDLAEVVVYNRAVSDTEVAALESYLRTKWGTA